MNRTSSAARSFPVLMGALLLSTASVSHACLQGSQFHARKPNFESLLIGDVVAQASLKPTAMKPAVINPEMPVFAAIDIAGSLTAPLAKSTPAAAHVSPTVESESEVYLRTVREFEMKSATSASLADVTDYAVALVYVGRHADAIKVLLALEARQPGVYTTAVNLGTAYELAGNLEEALKWIGVGIERNAESHAGTEWLHLAILRAKVELRDDADWLKKHSVLDGTGTRSANEILRAIEYQLAERLQFVKPSDAVVCDLFYQAALRATDDAARPKRALFAQQSLRFGDWRKSEIAALAKL